MHETVLVPFLWVKEVINKVESRLKNELTLAFHVYSEKLTVVFIQFSTELH